LDFAPIVLVARHLVGGTAIAGPGGARPFHGVRSEEDHASGAAEEVSTLHRKLLRYSPSVAE
jgi:hypothetical protein